MPFLRNLFLPFSYFNGLKSVVTKWIEPMALLAWEKKFCTNGKSITTNYNSLKQKITTKQVTKERHIYSDEF